MSRFGFPGLGEDYAGFLHMHPSSGNCRIRAGHILVDQEDWLAARKMAQVLREIKDRVDVDGGFDRNDTSTYVKLEEVIAPLS